MDLRVLNYFMTVAREKTISRAAETLYLSQPALSKQLKELETELGVQLFIRGNREITLTEEGTYLVNRGKEILSLVETTTANLKKNDIIGGDITIGGGETQAFQFISRILNVLLEQYPEINVHLYSGNADDIKEKIDKGLLDFGLVIDPVEKQKYDYLPLPLSDRWGILINDGHPLACKTQITSADLVEQPLLISSQSLVDNQLADWLGGNLSNYNVVGTYNLLYNASVLVKYGQTIALCIDGIINTKNLGLTFIPFAPPLTANISVIWKKNGTFSNVARLFFNELVHSASQENR